MNTETDQPTPAERAALIDWLARAPATGEPGAMELAAWLEGGLDEDGARRVELWLARAPDHLDGLRAARAVVDDAVPEADIRRARSLVRAPDAQAGARAPSWPVRLLGGTLGLATGAAGLVVGLGLAHIQAQAETQMLAALVMGLAGFPGAW